MNCVNDTLERLPFISNVFLFDYLVESFSGWESKRIPKKFGCLKGNTNEKKKIDGGSKKRAMVMDSMKDYSLSWRVNLNKYKFLPW